MRYTRLERTLAAVSAALAMITVLVLGLYFAEGPTRDRDTTLRVLYTGPPDSGPPESGPPDSGPQSSARPTRPGTSAARGGAPGMTAGYEVRGKWAGGFDAELVVTNLGSQPVTGWAVQLELPEGVTVTRAWAADASGTAPLVTLRSQPWNTYIAPGAAVRFGFTATGAAAAPRSCTVNGAPC